LDVIIIGYNNIRATKCINDHKGTLNGALLLRTSCFSLSFLLRRKQTHHKEDIILFHKSDSNDII